MKNRRCGREVVSTSLFLAPRHLLLIMGKAQSKPPPPPPLIDVMIQRVTESSEALYAAITESPEALYAVFGCLVLTFLFLVSRKRTPKYLVATCELGAGGKPCGSVAQKPVNTALPPTTGHRPTTARPSSAIVQQFAPELQYGRVSGSVTLTEQPNGDTLIAWDVTGLSPGEHGFHIHESADFSNGCVSAGPHYNPFGTPLVMSPFGTRSIRYPDVTDSPWTATSAGKNHGGPNDKDRHVGDLGNIKADVTGRAKGQMIDSLVKLRGPYSVLGRSMMVHADPDDLGRGDNSKAHEPGPPKNGFVSKITGNAGARLVCGEIKLAGAPGSSKSAVAACCDTPAGSPTKSSSSPTKK